MDGKATNTEWKTHGIKRHGQAHIYISTSILVFLCVGPYEIRRRKKKKKLPMRWFVCRGDMCVS